MEANFGIGHYWSRGQAFHFMFIRFICVLNWKRLLTPKWWQEALLSRFHCAAIGSQQLLETHKWFINGTDNPQLLETQTGPLFCHEYVLNFDPTQISKRGAAAMSEKTKQKSSDLTIFPNESQYYNSICLQPREAMPATRRSKWRNNLPCRNLWSIQDSHVAASLVHMSCYVHKCPYETQHIPVQRK